MEAVGGSAVCLLTCLMFQLDPSGKTCWLDLGICSSSTKVWSTIQSNPHDLALRKYGTIVSSKGCYKYIWVKNFTAFMVRFSVLHVGISTHRANATKWRVWPRSNALNVTRGCHLWKESSRSTLRLKERKQDAEKATCVSEQSSVEPQHLYAGVQTTLPAGPRFSKCGEERREVGGQWGSHAENKQGTGRKTWN